MSSDTSNVPPGAPQVTYRVYSQLPPQQAQNIHWGGTVQPAGQPNQGYQQANNPAPFVAHQAQLPHQQIPIHKDASWANEQYSLHQRNQVSQNAHSPLQQPNIHSGPSYHSHGYTNHQLPQSYPPSESRSMNLQYNDATHNNPYIAQQQFNPDQGSTLRPFKFSSGAEVEYYNSQGRVPIEHVTPPHHSPSSHSIMESSLDENPSLEDGAASASTVPGMVRGSLPLYAIATTNSTTAKRSKASSEMASNTSKRGFRNSRRRHRNSHLGCATCKSRRIKCDEQLPECRNCVRARLTCAYLALDETARDALKVAQQAHAARIQALNIQDSALEAKNQYLYPYQYEGLPTRIFTTSPPPYPHPNVQPIQINLQQPFFPPIPNTAFMIPPQPHSQSQLPIHHESVPNYSSYVHNQNNVHTAPHNSTGDSYDSSKFTPNVPSESTEGSPIEDHRPKSDSTAKTSVSPEPRFAIESESYATLAALIKDHKDIEHRQEQQQQQQQQQQLDDLAKLDNKYVEITLDPNCTKHLNKNWDDFNKSLLPSFETGFEKEYLYKEYDSYHAKQMKEAKNNIVLFKALLSTGAAILAQNTKRHEVQVAAKFQLDRDFEITLRFLNKFRIKFTQDVSDMAKFFENVSLCFSKFQIYQAAIPTTFYGAHTMNDNVELTNRFFDFLINYLNEEFKVFMDEKIVEEHQDNKLFQRTTLFNGYMHVFITYYVQCIKAYHTRPYNSLFMEEVEKNFKELKPIIYHKLTLEDQTDYDNLEEFLANINEYFKATRDGTVETNRIQIIFYSMKKFLSIIPTKTYNGFGDHTFETYLLSAYFHAVTGGIKAIFAETRFFFLFAFNARDGTRSAASVREFFKSGNLTDEQKKLLEYPLKVNDFFLKRTLLISQLLSEVSTFPAKIMLDEPNKQISMNLVQEDQIYSFEGEVNESAYPHIDENSNFYNKATNSIVIPSVSSTRSHSNFAVSHTKRIEILKRSVEAGLSEVDRKLINNYFRDAYKEVEDEE